MILVAHIYGSFNAIDPVIAIAKKHNLLVAEDCAQVYTDISVYTGHPESDVAMFSFGTVKTATALGGGILRVNDARVLAEMKERESHYESRSNSFFFKRAVKYGILQSLTTPSNWGLFVRTCHLFGHDHDDIITKAVRGFIGGELMTLLRKRPSLGLLTLLDHRLATIDAPYLALRKLQNQKLLALLKDEPNILVPGANAEEHVFWTFGVVVPDRQHVIDYMNPRVRASRESVGAVVLTRY
jgi:perosamine synthetase